MSNRQGRGSAWRNGLNHARKRANAIRRRFGVESLEDRRLLSGFNRGDFYYYQDQKIPLLRADDQVLLAVQSGADRQAVDSILAKNGLLQDATLTPTTKSTLWQLTLNAPRQPAALDQLVQRLGGTPGVTYAAQTFVNTAAAKYGDTARLAATNELLVGLANGQRPDVVFSGPSFVKYRPLLGTPDQFIVTVTTAAGPATLALANTLQATDQRVTYASPNFLMTMQPEAVNDPLFATQWHLSNTGQNGGIPGADAHVTGVWDKGINGAGIVVAVTDVGTQLDHPDLNIWTNPGEIAGNGKDDDGNGWVDDLHGWDFWDDDNDPSPGQGDDHGTAVAGVATEVGNNNLGGIGPAFGASVMVIRIPLGVAATADQFISPVYYAAGRTADGAGKWKAADIDNHSYGGRSPITGVDAAFTWSAQNGRGGLGLVNFCSTGNGADAPGYNQDPHYPSDIPEVIGVGGTTEADVRVSYSEYGPGLMIVAPTGSFGFNGIQNIVTTDRTGSVGYDPGDYTGLYATGFSGTSSATPLAAGIGALMVAANPTLKLDDVKQILRDTADKVGTLPYTNGKNTEYGYGRINATKAVTEALGRLLQLTVFDVTGTENSLFSGRVATVKPGDKSLPLTAYAASIDWGDGRVTQGSLTASSGGLIDVSGNHSYVNGGKYTITVTVMQQGPNPITVSDTSQAAISALPIFAQGTTIIAKEGDDFRGVVATFTDSDPRASSPTNYTATIDWGDGTKSAGTIEALPSGGFRVTSATTGHLFGGGNYDVKVSIVGVDTSSAEAISPAFIKDSLLESTGRDVNPVEGQVFTLPVASFHDLDPRKPGVGNYFASIDWGDGTTTAAATITPDPFTGGFFVSGSHAYSFGSYPIAVTIGNHSGDSSTIATGTAIVSDAPLASQSFSFVPTQGKPFSGIISAFTDGDPRKNPTSHYTAFIDWGDGTRESSTDASKNVVIDVNTDGGYLIRSTHTYRLAGAYTIKSSVTNDGGSSATSSATATVPDAAIVLTLAPAATPQEGVPFSGAIASFTSANPLALPGDFSSTINWGDGTESSGLITVSTTGGFNISSSAPKVYATLGSYVITVTVRNNNGPQGVKNGKITVSDAPITATPAQPAIVGKTVFTGVVANFTDANPNSKAGEFTATIDWGDATASSPGTLMQNPQGGYAIQGSHTYATSGPYAISVTIVSSGGSTVKVVNPVQVAPRYFPLHADLIPTNIFNGATGGVINQSQPLFTGTSEAGARVELFAQPTGSLGRVSIGTVVADPSGNWSLVAASLPDGSYLISGDAVDTFGQPSSALTTLYPTATRGELVIDTAGPKITSSVMNARTGQLTLNFADSGSGLNLASLTSAANFSLQVAGSNGRLRNLPVTGLTVSPFAPPTSPTLTATFTVGRLRPGTYVLRISAAGVTDKAGNALDERFFVPFPSLYGQAGGDYTAKFVVGSNSRRVLPTQYVPLSEAQAAASINQFIRARTRARIRRGR